MATTSPPSPPAAPPPPGAPGTGAAACGRRAPARSGSSRSARSALVVLIVAYLVFAGGGGATYKLEFAEADQLVRGDQVQVGGVPVGSVTNIELTHDFKAAGHDPRRLLARAAAPRHARAGARAVADERRQPLHRADARAQQQPRPTRPARRCRRASPAKSPTSTSCSTRSTRRRARACRGSSREPPNSTSGRARTSAPRSNTSRRRSTPPTTSSPSCPRPAGLHELPRRNGEGGDDDRRAPGIARGPDRKPEHDLPGDRRRAERARAAASNSCQGRCSQGNKHVRRTAGDVRRAQRARQGIQADDEVADDAARTPAAAAGNGHAGRDQLQPGVQPPRTQQRPHRPRARAARRSPSS